ncbi:MAG: thiamine pyrophosphate-dependent dehydrogenase E1 component subunit alpha [Chloroflexota bacterium]
MDLWSLYYLMKKSRQFEAAITQLWEQGLISAEMHLGTGEEAIIAGVVSHLVPGDAMAVDHRGSAPFLMRGVDPISMLKELLGFEDGLCGGMGGHMHLLSKEHLAASSGIVGAGGPTAVGFALAAQHLRPGTIAVAFFGEGAMNQGMLLESINMASVWSLPVLFVCKDDDWSITTESKTLTGGELGERVRGLGVRYVESDGMDVEAVRKSAGEAIERARAGKGPSFLHTRCVHLEGHLLGFSLLRIIRNPLKELPKIAVPLTRSFLRLGGGSLRDRLAGMRIVLSRIMDTIYDGRQQAHNDPVLRARNALQQDTARLQELDRLIEQEISAALEAALVGVAQ